MRMDVKSSPDKIIVDKTKHHRNSEVLKAVRSTRSRLQNGGDGLSHFEHEFIELYLDSALQSAAAIPLLVGLITLAGFWLGTSTGHFQWALFTLTLHALHVFAIRAIKSGKAVTQDNARSWIWRLNLMQTAMGICWALFALQACTNCVPMAFTAYKGASLLVALAASAMSAFMLRGAVLSIFVPTVAALTFQTWLSQNALDMGLVATLATTATFFVYVTGRLQRSGRQIMSFRSEKDDLIAELEVAKAVSDEARRRAEDANLAKSRFLASMSHELRTPLNAILGFSEVMSNEVMGPLNNPMYKEYANDINNSGKHLLNLINEILDLSRIEAGRYELQETAVSLTDVAEDCIGMVQLKANNKSIRINEQFEPGMPAVWADEKSMRQIVLNLLSNAVKFTPQSGEITVKVGWTAGGGQYVSIKDNGPGISEDEIPVVLSAFGQGSIAIKSAEQGTGLGLPIVQALLAKHGGDFVLKSKLREGTEVIAILPAKRVLQSVAAVEEVRANKRRNPTFA
ncbi:HAMP domain-containing sensor histidine kinase [Rhizobium sp. L1K21]|uniref:sensor histidine kinase n=1 Tax=Rhizobium sp. L1K21 TaxID=2954933 RepID=UPI002092FBEF|nr:HAMP domain-containing sensor histidine kinase [Rhizobium sp. L1K21]MCO6186241.1 HAMP domain-containing histidine kinase [Rhizobium sp. L1K21]